MRNTARRVNATSRQAADEPITIDLLVYRHGEVVYSAPAFGRIPPDGTLVIRESDVAPARAGNGDEDEFLIVARVRKGGGEPAFFAQEHQLAYTHRVSNAQAHLLYDQQPARPQTARTTPIVFLMPKIWVGQDVNTYVVVSNTWEVAELSPQAQPVRFSLLDAAGAEVSTWEHNFVCNEAKIFDMRKQLGSATRRGGEPRFLNLVGRGGASSFVLFAIIRHCASNHFAVEHSLPPLYYMDGSVEIVREQGCDPVLFRRPLAARR